MRVDDDIAAVIAALCAGDWDGYVQLVVAFDEAHGTGTIWPVLARAHGTQVDVFERLLAWPMQQVRIALRRLMPVVQHFGGLSLSDAGRFLEFADRPDPSFRHGVAQQLRPHIAAEPAIGTGLGEALRCGVATRDGATRVWAAAFSEAAPEEAAHFALILLAGVGRDHELLAILLQFLPVRGVSVEPLLRLRQEELTAALLATARSNGHDAWVALTVVMDLSVAAMNALESAVKAGEVQAATALSNVLYRVSSTTVGATAVPLGRLVDDLLSVAFTDEDARRWVDAGVAALLHREALRFAVMPSIAKLGAIDEPVAEQLSGTFDALSERPDDFAVLLTEWLVGEGVTFAATRSLLSRCSVQPALAGLDADVFWAAPPPRRVVAARRLLALTHNGPVLCQFIADLAQTPALQPEGLAFAAQMLNEAFVEYPGATLDFLRERTKATGRAEPFAHVYRGVYANALRWRRVLKHLPPRKELRLTDGQAYALRAMKQRVNRDIMRAATQRSVFASLATNVHVAQGRRFTSHTAHSRPQVADMQLTSHSMELPSSELADPVGGMIRRVKQLGASR